MAPLSREQRARLEEARARLAASRSRIHAIAADSVRAAFGIDESKSVFEGNDGRWYQADAYGGTYVNVERIGPALTVDEHMRDLTRPRPKSRAS